MQPQLSLARPGPLAHRTGYCPSFGATDLQEVPLGDSRDAYKAQCISDGVLIRTVIGGRSLLNGSVVRRWSVAGRSEISRSQSLFQALRSGRELALSWSPGTCGS